MEEINGVEGLWICTWDFCGCQEINLSIFLFVKACMAYGLYPLFFMLHNLHDSVDRDKCRLLWIALLNYYIWNGGNEQV
jgi:hypothetical protein